MRIKYFFVFFYHTFCFLKRFIYEYLFGHHEPDSVFGKYDYFWSRSAINIRAYCSNGIQNNSTHLKHPLHYSNSNKLHCYSFTNIVSSNLAYQIDFNSKSTYHICHFTKCCKYGFQKLYMPWHNQLPHNACWKLRNKKFCMYEYVCVCICCKTIDYTIIFK